MTEPATLTGKRLCEGGEVMVWPEDVLAIEREAAKQERERLKAAAFRPYEPGSNYGQCMVCGEDGTTKEDVDVFFEGEQP